MSARKRICVAIVNYRTPGLTLDCIRSLRPQLDPGQDQVVVVDNHSGGDDLATLENSIATEGLAGLVSLIPSGANNGFSAGNNIGIQAVAAHFYLLTNADTVFRPEAIAGLLAAATAHPEAGIISPRLEWPDGEPQISCFRFHSPWSELINAAGTGPVTRLLKRYDVPLPVVAAATTPDWTSFACVLVRGEIFQRVGLLDEGFFMYYEDVDYCRRVGQAGSQILNWPWARVVHLRGQSSEVKRLERDRKRLPPFYYRSRARYYTKFYGRSGLLAANLGWLAGRSVSLLRERLCGRRRTVPEYQHLDIWQR